MVPSTPPALFEIVEGLFGGRQRIKHDIDLGLTVREKQTGQSYDLERTALIQAEAVDRLLRLFQRYLQKDVSEECILNRRVPEWLLASASSRAVAAWKRTEANALEGRQS